MGFLRKNGRYTTLDWIGGNLTQIRGINNHGEMVGTYIDSAGATHGLRVTRGVFVSIDFPASTSTSTSAINDNRQIVGSYIASGQTSNHGYMANLKGIGIKFFTIDFPAATSTVSSGINLNRNIVGSYLDSAAITHGYLREN